MTARKSGSAIVSSVVRHVRRSGRNDFGNWCIGVVDTTPTTQGLLLWAEAFNESEAETVVRHMSQELGMQQVGSAQGTIVVAYPKSNGSSET